MPYIKLCVPSKTLPRPRDEEFSHTAEDQNDVDKMRKILKTRVECNCFETAFLYSDDFFSFFLFTGRWQKEIFAVKMNRNIRNTGF